MRIRKSKSAPVGVLGKVLSVLELLDQSPQGLQLWEIAAKTGINKSTVHRFLSHLESEGYLFRDAIGAYMLGPKLVRMGSGIGLHATLCRVCRPTLERLRAATDGTVTLAVLDGAEILNLDVLESQRIFRLVFPIGARHSIHCTALGKVILANLLDDRHREEILSSIDFTRYTPRTVGSAALLRKSLVGVRKQGFSLDDEESMMGARCVGAAILDSGGEVAGGIGISGPVTHITNERLAFFSSAARKAAWEISSQLGNRSPELEYFGESSSVNGKKPDVPGLPKRRQAAAQPGRR